MISGWSSERTHDFLTQYVESRLPHWLTRYLGVSDVVQSVCCQIGGRENSFRGDTELQYRRWLEGIDLLSRRLIEPSS